MRSYLKSSLSYKLLATLLPRVSRLDGIKSLAPSDILQPSPSQERAHVKEARFIRLL